MNFVIKKLALFFEPQIAWIAKRYVGRDIDRDWLLSQEGRFIGPRNERTIEYAFVFKQLDRVCPKTVLDVGTGRTAWPHCMATAGFAVSAIDNITDYWSDDVWNRHWRVENHDIQRFCGKQRYDAITCISVLEHIRDHRAAVRNMFGMLNEGGYLLITCPFNKSIYHENIYTHPDAGYGQKAKFICQVFSDAQLEEWLTDNGGAVDCEEFYKVFTGELWTFGERLYPIEQTTRDEPHHLGCFALKKSG